MNNITQQERDEHRLFHFRGGPADGMLMRLYRSPPVGSDVEGWEQMPWGDKGVYNLDPDHADPWTSPKTKPNKQRTDCPHMIWTDER